MENISNINNPQLPPIQPPIEPQLPPQPEPQVIQQTNNIDKQKLKKWFKNTTKIVIVTLLLFIIYLTANYFYSKTIAYKADYRFDIKDYNLPDYFGSHILGKRTKITWSCGMFETCRAYEWQITFKDYYGNQQIYKIDTASNFYDQVSEISQHVIENEVKTTISQKYNTLGDKLIIQLDTRLINFIKYSDTNVNSANRYYKDVNSNTFFKKNYPKDVNFNTFFTNNPGAIFTIYLPPEITNNEINDMANLLFGKSNNSLNLIFNREGIYSACMDNDIRYFKNKLTYNNDCYGFYFLIESEQDQFFLKTNEVNKETNIKKSFTKGEVAIFDKFEVKANLTEGNFVNINPNINISDNEKLVGVKVSVKNIGEKDKELDMYSFNLFTDISMGEFTLYKDCEFCNFANQIESGETQSAILVFKIKKDATNLKLQLKGTKYTLGI